MRAPAESSRKRWLAYAAVNVAVLLAFPVWIPTLQASLVMMGAFHYGLFSGVILVVAWLRSRDLARMQESEALLARQELKLELASQMETVGRLSAAGEVSMSLAHELRNPLSVLYGLGEAARMDADAGAAQPERMRWLAAKVTGTVEKMNKIIDGLTRFGRPGAGAKFETVAARRVVQNAAELIERKLVHAQVDIQVAYTDPGVTVECREIELSQVILNLLSNSIDAVEKLRDRWVRVEVRQLDGEAGSMLEIVVTDSGAGIPEPIAAKIMEPFFTTKPVGKGTGLGLSISHRILKEHGGELRLNREYPQTQFIIRLPTCQVRTQDSSWSRAA